MKVSARSSLIAHLAEFCSHGHVPSDVRERARREIVDNLACQWEGATNELVKTIQGTLLPSFAWGHSRVSGRPGVRVAAEGSAMLNGVSATIYESDDYHPGGLIHAGSVTVPAALAVGAEVDAPLEQVVEAVALGSEIAIRISAACQPSMNHTRAIHPTLAIGPIGAAAAAGYLIQLSQEQMAQALSIAGSFAGGPMEYSLSGGEAKRLNAGQASSTGVRAARLAQVGVTGPPTVIEGPRGIMRTMSDAADWSVIENDLESLWYLRDLAYKPYFCNGMLQGPLHALKQLRTKQNFSADKVSHIRIGLSNMGAAICGTKKDVPKDLLEAQFDGRFACSLMIARGGAGSMDFIEQQKGGFSDDMVLKWMEKIEIDVDDDAERAFPDRFVSSVTVEMSDGCTDRMLIAAPGTAEAPLSEEELLSIWQSRLASGGFQGQAQLLMEYFTSDVSTNKFLDQLEYPIDQIRARQ